MVCPHDLDSGCVAAVPAVGRLQTHGERGNLITNSTVEH